MTLHTCPQCRCRFHDDDDLDRQLAAQVARWKVYCDEHGHPILDGRVSEVVAAELLQMRQRTLAGRRKSDNGPLVALMPVNGTQYSYDLLELAAWKFAQVSGDSWKT